MGADDTTDRLFPHQMVPVSSTVERPVELPLPLQRSIRQEFAEHRLFIEDQLKAYNTRLDLALQRLSPQPSVGGAVRGGLLAAGKLGPVVLATLGLLEVVVPLVKPEWMGPLKALREMLGAPQ
jgi:hypothetical protein